MSATVMGWLLGTVLGMRHALEPDHLVAVSTLVADGIDRRRSAWLGAFWGMGHALGLLALGGTLAAVQAELPERMAGVLELAVAVMLGILGIRALGQAVLMRQSPSCVHWHDGSWHAHPSQPVHADRIWRSMRRPLAVGVVHGLAGSGAVVALALANQPSVLHSLAYIAVFGLGSVLCMGALTGVAGGSLARVMRRRGVAAGMLLLSGGLSVALGVAWGAAALGRVLG